jgi:hypothetical protein
MPRLICVNRRMPSLHDMLWNLTMEDLRIRQRFLAPGARVTLKADLIGAIKGALEGEGLRRAYESLDETERLAVAEAVYNPDHLHHPERFQSKYGRPAEFHRRPPDVSEHSFWKSAQNATALLGFFYAERHATALMIPHDLAARLRPIVAKPRAAELPAIPDPEPGDRSYVRHTESEALAEVGALLRLAGLGNLRFSEATGMPAKASLAGIEAVLAGGDWFPPSVSRRPDKRAWEQEIGPIKPVGWTRLLEAAGLVGMHGAKSALTPAGRRAIERAPWETILAIWEKWCDNKKYDEFNRIDVIKGQSVRGALTARQARRVMPLAALAECPAGAWVSFDGFSHYMRAAGHMFEVSPDPWKLYISDRQYGALGYAGYGGWDVLQDRYLLCLLMEYAAPLGLIDIAYDPPDCVRPVDNWGMDCYSWLSRYDGLVAFRVTALGAYCLGGGTSSFRPSRPQAAARLTVLPNRTIRVAAGTLSPAERTQLETWAEPVDDHTFRADETRALDAFEAGQDPDSFAAFLRERDEQPLPETMESFLKQARENGGAIRQGAAAILFECRDARTAELLASSKELAKVCFRAGDATLAVREDALPAFRKQARALGFGIR